MKKKNGYTLIELIVVIAISSIFLAMITTVVIQFSNTKKAITVENERVEEVSTLKTNLDSIINFINHQGSAPTLISSDISVQLIADSNMVFESSDTLSFYKVNSGSNISYRHITKINAVKTINLLTIRITVDTGKVYEYQYYVLKGVS